VILKKNINRGTRERRKCERKKIKVK
jgi:hypothetical protein